MWNDEVEVNIQSFSPNHVDMVIKTKELDSVHFTGFYGLLDPSQNHLSWDLLRNIVGGARDDWIVGGDFNEIIMNPKKVGEGVDLGWPWMILVEL